SQSTAGGKVSSWKIGLFGVSAVRHICPIYHALTNAKNRATVSSGSGLLVEMAADFANERVTDFAFAPARFLFFSLVGGPGRLLASRCYRRPKFVRAARDRRSRELR